MKILRDATLTRTDVRKETDETDRWTDINTRSLLYGYRHGCDKLRHDVTVSFTSPTPEGCPGVSVQAQLAGQRLKWIAVGISYSR